jgi:hypothetical protein
MLAEVPSVPTQACRALFSLEVTDDSVLGDEIEMIDPLEDTQRGTRWIRERNPAGRVCCLETEGNSP